MRSSNPANDSVDTVYRSLKKKMPHIQSKILTQRIICLKKCIENYYSPWKLILLECIKIMVKSFCYTAITNVIDLLKHLPQFYRECLEVWAKLSAKQIISRDQVMNQILWSNQYLRIDEKPQFCKKSLIRGNHTSWEHSFI